VRQSGSEIQALLVSSITFGLLHGLNIVNGQGFGLTLQQVILTVFAGVSFYAARRASGSLLLAMLLHGIFDFQLLMQGITHRSGDTISSISIANAALLYLEVIAAIIIVVKVARDSRRGAV
jgi:membrane protease YdiL (CAAX protease family)